MSENSLASPTGEHSLPPGFALTQSDQPNVPEGFTPLDLDEGLGAKETTDKRLPTIALIAAGLTVFDAILAIAIVGLWSFQRALALEMLPTIAGPMLLCGVAPLIVGGLVYNESRRAGTEIVGAHWGRWAIIAGAFLSTITLLIPLAAAITALSGGSI